MNHFEMKNGALHAEEVAIADIAAAVGTPFYCYSTATLERHYRVFAEAFSDVDATVCYALKANGNQAVVRIFASLGAGADVVSGGELRQALAAGVPAERIVFSGVGKTADEMTFALDEGILQFNIESLPELEVLNSLAEARGLRAPIALRVNPDVDAKTHAKISTGMSHNKFGIAADDAPAVARHAAGLPGVELIGLAMHIGSQLTDLGPYELAFKRLAEMTLALRGEGHKIESLDVGGGLGIRYRDETPPAPEAYAEMVKRAIAGLDCKLLLEPGRMMVGNAGVLVTKALYIKQSGERRFVIIDAGMNDLLRPAMYDGYHEIETVAAPAEGDAATPADIVGPICESGDTFAKDRPLPTVAAGDLLAIRTAGAYGAIMASSYNMRPLIPEVLVNGERFAIIRRRPEFDEMTALEALPDWLTDSRPAKRGAA
jgi:diaminopimelate decarboxylase